MVYIDAKINCNTVRCKIRMKKLTEIICAVKDFLFECGGNPKLFCIFAGR